MKLVLPPDWPQALKSEFANSARNSSLANFVLLALKISSLALIKPAILNFCVFIGVINLIRIFTPYVAHKKWILIFIMLTTWLGGLGWMGMFNEELSHWGTLINFEVLTTMIILIGSSAVIATSMAFWPIAAFGYILITAIIPGVLIFNYEPSRHIGLIGFVYGIYLSFNVFRIYSYLLQKTNEQRINSHKEQLLQTLVDSIPGYVSLLDKNLNYKIISKNLSQKLSLNPTELIGKKIGHQGFKSDFINFIYKFNEDGEVVKSERFQISLHPEGEPRWHLVILTRSPQGDLIVVSLDIHEQIQKEEELSLQRAFVVHSNQLAQLGEMMGTVAHEVNAPLGVLKISLGILKDSIKDSSTSPQNLTNQVEKLEKNTARIEKIILGLKSTVREAHQDPLIPVSIKTLIDDSLEMVRRKLDAKGIAFFQEDIPNLQVQGREVQLGQVLTNLLRNSVEAIGDMKNPWIKVSLNKTEDKIQIKITDSGPGISPEIRKKIMQPFFTTKPVGRGTGLGLAVCQKILKDHQGNLFVDENCSNTCFIIELPNKA